MLFSLLRYGALRSPLGYNFRSTRVSTSVRLALSVKTPKTTNRALSTAPSNPCLVREDSKVESFADEVLPGVRLDQLVEDALLIKEDDVEIQEELERWGEGGELSGDSPVHSAAEDGLSDPDAIAEAKRDVLDALHHKDPEKLLRAFQLASVDETYVGSIPATTFREILRMLDPETFVDPYKRVLRDLRPHHVQQLGAKQLQDIFEKYVNVMTDIMRKRGAAGFKMGIGEYKCILNCVRSGGDGEAARAVWKNMLKDGIKPDTICYNLYFEALCWSNAFDPVEREKLRVIPYHMSMRRPVQWGQQRRQGFRGYLVGDIGIKQEVIKLFSNMVKMGIVADETTFCLLMTAMAREGDLVGPKSILKKVWNVDVEILLSQDDNAMQSAEFLPTTSPVYPSKQLLFTIAHIFGSNNDIPTALRVVDHISRKFSISIPREVWDQLLEWTFVLASRRHGDRKSDGAQLGQLPLQSVESLWNTMVSEPYNIKPTVPMYYRLIRSLWNRDMLGAMLLNMRVVRQRWLLDRAQLDREIRLYDESKVKTSRASQLPTPIEAMPKKLRLMKLYEARDFAIVRRSVRRLLAGRRWNWDREPNRLGWQLRGLPIAMDEWGRFKPRDGFFYNIYAGRLQFDPRNFLTMPIRWTESTSPGITIVQHADDGLQE